MYTGLFYRMLLRDLLLLLVYIYIEYIQGAFAVEQGFFAAYTRTSSIYRALFSNVCRGFLLNTTELVASICQ